jgi:hypothetical protein
MIVPPSLTELDGALSQSLLLKLGTLYQPALGHLHP